MVCQLCLGCMNQPITLDIHSKKMLEVLCFHFSQGMSYFEEWKSCFPVSPSHAHLLISDSERSTLGPLIFNPNPQTLTLIFSSPSLLPPPIHTPKQSLFRFLEAATPDSPILPSTAPSIASVVGSQLQDNLPFALRYNQLEILSNRNSVILFFPTGENFERIGYFIVYFDGSNMRIKLDGNGNIFQVSFGKSHRIIRMSVNPVVNGNKSIIGYLLVSTRFAVHWFSVRCDSQLERPYVVHECSKTFNTSSVAYARWSPHMPEESLVLLENGSLFLFALIDATRNPTNLKENRLNVKWPHASSKDQLWVSCDFSWLPRIFIVVASHAVFLVDCTNDTHVVSCLLTVDLLHMHPQAQNEQFLALTKAGPDNFYFIVASNNLLLLCDVRKPMRPILKWAHDVDNPTYINVVNLFQLRSHSREDSFDSASKAGFCIILGSFFSGNFNLFCYGPSLLCKEGSFASQFSKTNKTLYAWELPYELAISGHYCRCGSCLLKEELLRENISKCINWQRKKVMVLGFNILSNDFGSSLCKSNEYGGFTLVRLMSSGNIELQRYQASWGTNKKLKGCHGEGVSLNKYVFLDDDDDKYKFPKTFVYLKLNYLYSYFRGNLTECLVKKLEGMDGREEKSLNMEVHEALCKKRNACGVGLSRSSPISIAFFKDVNPSASLYEVALRGLWAKLPLNILQLAFSTVDQEKASMEFLAIPPHNKLPPFFLRKSSPCNSKCSDKDQCNMMGPILPLSVLLVLHKINYSSSDLKDPMFSVETEVSYQLKEVMKLAHKISISALGSELFDDLGVSHDDGDAEETWIDPSFVLYRPILFDCSATDSVCRNLIDQYKIHHTLAFNVLENKTVSEEKSESVGKGTIVANEKYGSCDLKAYNALKIHMSRWKEGFGSYKKFCIQTKIQKAINN